MAALDNQWKKIVKQLKKLEVDTRKARGDARARLKKLDKQTRRVIERTLREAEPRVRKAMKDAARIGRGLRAGMTAGAAAYRASTRRRRK
ncbi:MAG TPA: hypothetical protein VGT02_10240 [Methylomirabilota bacterium]|jgi:hypothetical protein|nr:hypothetical protein [Methylomirabilota bacterium]